MISDINVEPSVSSEIKAVDDQDPAETREWLEAIDSVQEYEGKARARFLLDKLYTHALSRNICPVPGCNTPYINTINQEDQETPSANEFENLEKLTNIMRWNAIMMVMRAGKKSSELGGHIATYGSSATLYEVGFNYFFRGVNSERGPDLIFIQGHSSPGIYARAFLENRLDEKLLDGFRQEALTPGISSYPHPWLMPDFWQFPTVSMGLGPLMGIYQAQFLKYLHNRGLANTEQRKVWVFCGDGETGEPETLGALNIAAREQLDNLIFVINCNLQRLDGPVWGNGQIIQELESIFLGAKWNVIKVIWGSEWDDLLAKDTQGFLKKRMNELLDGEYQNFESQGGAYLREHFFGKYPELLSMVSDYSDQDLEKLRDGGHDPLKVYAAYHAAVNHKGQPTVILAKTIKGYGMGGAGEGRNIAHNTKKMNLEDLKVFRDRFKVPLTDKAIEHLDYFKPAENSPEMEYLRAHRKKLGGFLPARHFHVEPLETPPLSVFQTHLEGTGEREISTTMGFVRILSTLLKDKHLGKRIVPIVPDESRTFGMEGLFRQIGIYSPCGQQYQPEDHKQLMFYREDKKGQFLQQGITEAGSMASWIAAATSYSSNEVTMIPFYIYYSMFGFQRFGDLAWGAGDARARGFIVGGTAGRTTLAGEGLQHQDGHNLLMFSFVPNCYSYDPCFTYEIAVIIQDGLRRMYHEQEDIYYYFTVMNENYTHPPMPKEKDVEKNIIKGMYLFQSSSKIAKNKVQLLGSGTILREVIEAAQILENEFNVSADIWSVTSFNELRRDVLAVERFNRLNPQLESKKSFVAECFKDVTGPIIAATDYLKLIADQIRSAIKQNYHVLGTDGYGRSDTRVALRDFFEVNASMIAYTALKALFDEGKLEKAELLAAMQKLSIDNKRPDPVTV